MTHHHAFGGERYQMVVNCVAEQVTVGKLETAKLVQLMAGIPHPVKVGDWVLTFTDGRQITLNDEAFKSKYVPVPEAQG